MHAMLVPEGGGIDNLQRVERQEPTPGPGEVCVRISAASLNFHDLLVVAGRMPHLKVPRIPLSDGAGRVVAVGEGVHDLQPGDRVVSQFFPNWERGEPDIGCLIGVPGDHVDGVAQDIACLPARAFARFPSGLSDAEASTLPCAALTAWRGLVTLGQVRQGQTVLLQGTGGVSLFGLQFAKAAGARTIITSSSDEKLERARALGADHTIHYKRDPKWGKKALEITGGRGVDHVLEIGGGDTFKESIRACAFGAHIAVIGIRAGLEAQINPAAIFARNLRIHGVAVGSRDEFQSMCQSLELNAIKPVISDTLAMVELAEAFRVMERSTHFGKIVVEQA